jgi:hypothetical protein
MKLRAGAPAFSFQLASPPVLIRQAPDLEEPGTARRTKIWELSKHLHCSIIGTCLSTSELRQILHKVNFICSGISEHDLHGHGVILAGQDDASGKLLHKCLDKRHRVIIGQFEQAKTVAEVRAQWREAVKRGDIPGGYWAVLTHAATTEALVREVFGEVHMLSHLVGAANRADIRRLSELEAQNAELQETLRRQQEQLCEGITSRDAKIRDLSASLARRIAETPADAQAGEASDHSMLTKLIGELERRLTSETNRRAAVETRLQRSLEELRHEQDRRSAAERRESVLRQELEAMEASLAPSAVAGAADAPARLDGVSLLYVGGRADQVSHLRALTEQLGAGFLHHDGGIEDRSGLLAGLVSRVDVVMFPVDCVSHEAVLVVKRLCRQAAKPYVPLRSAGIGSFVAALNRDEVSALRGELNALMPG